MHETSYAPPSSLIACNRTLIQSPFSPLYQPSFGVYFYSYAFTKDLLIDMKRREKRKVGGSEELTAVEELSSVLFAGTTAGVSSWLFTYPIDVVKSARQMVVTKNPPPSSWTIAKAKWNEEGHRCVCVFGASLELIPFLSCPSDQLINPHPVPPLSC